MDEHDLRRSLQTVGPRQPVLMFDGERIDGKMRERLCNELDIPIEIHHCRTLGEACALLWPLHPERALKLAGPRSLQELAELCGARVAAVAQIVQKQRPPRNAHRVPRHVRGQKLNRLKVWIEPQLRTLAEAAATKEGTNISQFTREAIWHRVQIVDARAPEHGTRYAPKMVKPPARKARG